MNNIEQAPIVLDEGLPENLSVEVQAAILRTRTGGWVHRAIQMGKDSVSYCLDLPEDYIFDDHTKKLLLEKNGIQVLKTLENGSIEGILPAEISEFLIGISDAKCYIRINGNTAEIVPLNNLESYTSGMTIDISDTSVSILSQLLPGVQNHQHVLTGISHSVNDIYMNLFFNWRAK